MQTTEDKFDSSKALDASLVDTESSGTALKEQDTSSRFGNDAHADDVDIRPYLCEKCEGLRKEKSVLQNLITLIALAYEMGSYWKVFQLEHKTKVESEPSNGSNDDITNQYECKQTLDVSAGTLNIHAGTSLNPTKEGLRVCSELGIHDHSNELSSLKLVPKVVPPVDKTATSRQELELLFHHHITMLRSYALSWKPCQGDSLNLPDHRKPKAITPDLPTEEPDNSLSMGDEHLNTIPETEKSSVENLVPIPSESKGISENICDVPSCDNDHFDAKCGIIDYLLSRDISIASPKIDFLPEEFAGELDLIDPILPVIDEDNFDEEEGEIDIDILQIEDEILREKLLNVNLLIDKIKPLNLTPSTPFMLEYPSYSPILVVDSNFLIEEVVTFLVSEDSIPPSIKSDFDSEGDIIFPNDLLNNDPISEYEHFTFVIEPDAPVINNFDELNEDECFDPRGGEIVFSSNIKHDESFTFVIRTFLPYLTYPEDSPLLLSTGSEDTIFNPGIST
ncbi:hypothetical protein Tco_0957055 [Tanacetum coccineum]